MEVRARRAHEPLRLRELRLRERPLAERPPRAGRHLVDREVGERVDRMLCDAERDRGPELGRERDDAVGAVLPARLRVRPFVRERRGDEDVRERAIVTARSAHAGDRPRAEDLAVPHGEEPRAELRDAVDDARRAVVEDDARDHHPGRLGRAAHEGRLPGEPEPAVGGNDLRRRRVQRAGDDGAAAGRSGRARPGGTPRRSPARAAPRAPSGRRAPR